jgi:hypothetical protein
MSDWLTEVIGDAEDALRWLRERPRTFGELRAEDIDWLRWMAANIDDQKLLERLSRDPDTDLRMWVACNPMTPQTVLWKLAADHVNSVRRGVAQNSSTSTPLLIRLNDDHDIKVRALVFKNPSKPSPFFSL